jgi:response regulator of citrate/malate metabolism
MEELSKRKAAILDVLDDQIEELATKLAKVQPLIDELNQLRRTRATLLSERSVTGGVSRGTRLTMEQVIQAFRENENEPMTPNELAEQLGVDPTVTRSHLNRHADTRYRKNGEGAWTLIGEKE